MIFWSRFSLSYFNVLLLVPGYALHFGYWGFHLALKKKLDWVILNFDLNVPKLARNFEPGRGTLLWE